MRIFSENVSQTEQAGFNFARTLNAGDVVWIFGGLGAGKTAFVRGMALALGCAGPVTSPSYSLAHEYAGRITLFHFDAYRLNDTEDLLDIGWEDYLLRGGVCAVEWAQRLNPLPCPGRHVTIEEAEGGRRIDVSEQ
ncbi:MAG: tRNA (adenosine(37)-N6)-threonylcarbamoyltransferase complex ATPase subunit type 1 TsaE [Oscillospiraceae bacterium]|jgi:tRNA threonylcarbamoyladenosine biosynthesis protein TsaE|nr:tRNA (adenosine(37)-N6)-threonylcarbamoyltransferase complex ATPase subunit type 1 TsaE [Oscillospiraceae bacterium]